MPRPARLPRHFGPLRSDPLAAWQRAGPQVASSNFINFAISNSEPLPFFLRFRLEQACGGDVDPRARVLDQAHAEAGLAQVAGGEKAADVRRDPAHHDRVDAG